MKNFILADDPSCAYLGSTKGRRRRRRGSRSGWIFSPLGQQPTTSCDFPIGRPPAPDIKTKARLLCFPLSQLRSQEPCELSRDLASESNELSQDSFPFAGVAPAHSRVSPRRYR